MADIEKIIEGLEFTKEMITFDPSTGKDIEPENLNEANKTTYDACVGAIAMLKEQSRKQVLSFGDGYAEGYKTKDQELVRCKDCKHRSEKLYDHYGNKYDKRYVCQIHDLAKKPDWFCADGEPKAEPVKTVTPEFSGGGSVWWIQCSECGHVLHSIQTECPGCHNKINWEGWN